MDWWDILKRSILSQLQANEHVDRAIRVQHLFKLVNRLFHPEDTVLDIEGVKVGGGNNVYIADHVR